MISALDAHLLCVLFVLLDMTVRAWRIEWLLRGTGTRVSFSQAVAINAVGDAACAVTPMRIGGEPARLWGMLRAGVPASAAFVAISIEILAAWPVILVAAGLLGWLFAPEWIAAAVPRLRAAASDAWFWILLVLVASGLAWVVARRASRHVAVARARRSIRRLRVYWRRMPAWPVAASVPMTALNLVSRTGMLVALALAEPSGMALGPLFFASFVLLYAQLILPTPSGAGVVDLGLLGGAAGDLGGATLLWWRFYSSGVGVLVGAAVLVRARLRDRTARGVRFPWPNRKETIVP
ncbi:MAG TPA: lysylphosphatidylglycerol synthase domain-containing protein [Gemmatimonadales bacterium]|nr:lysylphosphatidylglycerol synthase domain-containing protein [Gemmatimonadales bacterium]